MAISLFPAPLLHLRPSALLIVLLLGASQAREARAETEVTRQASAHFAAGVAYLQGNDTDRYNQAYREFKAAYATSPTWTILGNLGIVAQELERYGEAREAYEKYLLQGGDEVDAREAVQIRGDLELLRAEGSTIALDAGSGQLWIVDTRFTEVGASVVNQYGPLTVERNSLFVLASTNSKYNGLVGPQRLGRLRSRREGTRGIR